MVSYVTKIRKESNGTENLASNSFWEFLLKTLQRFTTNLKKTTTYCPNCPDHPQLCIECFKVLHFK